MKEYRDKSYQEAYQRFKASRTSGQCEECGWKDGDGVTACFYSSEIGEVTHEDSPAAVAARMTDSQRSLMESYESSLLVPWDRESKLLWLRAAEDRYQHDAGWIDAQLAKPPAGVISNKPIPHRYAVEYVGWMLNPHWIPARLEKREFWPAHFRPSGMLVEYTDGGKAYSYTTEEDWIAYSVHVYKPHACGKGHGKFIAPYHLGCTGCAEEVKLWEFGVDPDCG